MTVICGEYNASTSSKTRGLGSLQPYSEKKTGIEALENISTKTSYSAVSKLDSEPHLLFFISMSSVKAMYRKDSP
jgi:hypothetical protein